MASSPATTNTFKPVEDQYPVFEPNQVLTSDLLNQAIYYLDDQTRETRAKLIGMGIACGLELSMETTPEVLLKLTCGKGITSHGYLIDMEACNMDRYREYTDPAGYDHFGGDAATGADAYDLYELLEVAKHPTPELPWT